MHLVADLYPRLAPLTGARLVRFSQLKTGSFFRRVTHGTGFGLIVLPGDSEDAQHLDPRGLQFIRWLDLDLLPLVELATSSAADDIVDTGTPHDLAVNDRVEFVELTGGAGLSTEGMYYVRTVPSATSFTLAATRGGAQVGFTSNITAGTLRKLRSVGGNWITGGDFEALSKRGTRNLALGGAGTMAYVQRAAMLAHTYMDWGQHPFDDMWRYQNQSTIFAGGARLGSYWWRTLSELTAPTRGSLEDGGATFHELPDLSFDFTGFVDSDGVAWPAYPGEFTVQVGEDDGLSVGERLVRLGLITDLDADDFVMRAWVASGRDLTGVAWAPDVVRFQVPTDDTGDTGNILNDASRAIAVAAKRKRLLVGSEDAWRIVTDASVDIEWTGGFRVDPGDADALEAAGQAQLRARLDAGDVPKIWIPLGNDPANGLYTPGPLDLAGAHLWDNDIVTLHSGEDAWDWDEVDVRVAAIEWRLADRQPGDNADVFIEGGSTFMPFDQRFEANPGSGTRNQPHGPHIRLCRPGMLPTTVTLIDWDWAGGLREPHAAIAALGQPSTECPPNPSTNVQLDADEGGYIQISSVGGQSVWLPDGFTGTEPEYATFAATPGTTYTLSGIQRQEATFTEDGRVRMVWLSGSYGSYTVLEEEAFIFEGSTAFTAFEQSYVAPSGATAGVIQAGFNTEIERLTVTSTVAGTVNDGHPDLVGTGSRATRCGHKHHVLRDSAPTVDDDWATAGYPTTTLWTQVDDLETPTAIVGTWLLLDATTGAAVWEPFGGGATDDQTAAEVPFTPTGTIAATDTQAAVAEVATDAAAALTAHTGDTTDAHDASAVSIADAGGYFTGTDVETALQELGAGGGTDDQTAAEVPYDNSGSGLTATDVQAAIDELEAAGGGGGSGNVDTGDAASVRPELQDHTTAGTPISFASPSLDTGCSFAAGTGYEGMITFAGGTDALFADVASAIGTGDFDVRARVLMATLGAASGSALGRIHFAVTDAARTQSTRLAVFAYSFMSSATVPYIGHRVGNGAEGAGLIRAMRWPLLMRIARVGTTVTFYFSLTEGLQWTTLNVATSSLNIGKVGFWGHSSTAASPMAAVIDRIWTP